MTAKTVLILGTGRDARDQRAVLATLPNDFLAYNGSETPDIVLVSGRDGTADAALDRVIAASAPVFVTSPSFLMDAQRERLATLGDVTIATAYSPALIRQAMSDSEEPAILDLTAMIRDGDGQELREALLSLVSLSRTILGDAAAARLLHRTSASLVIEMTAPSGLCWRLSAHRGLRDSLAIDHVSRGQRFHIADDREPHGRPAAISRYDGTGTQVAWPVYQDGYRTCWASLASGGQAGGDALNRLTADLALIDAALSAA